MLATILVYLSQYIGTCIANDLKDINTHIHIREDFFVSNRNALTYVVSYKLSDNGILGVTKGYKLYDEALKHIEHKINLLCLLSNKYALEEKTTHDERRKINKLCNYSTRIEKAIKNVVDNFFDIFERNSADISELMRVGIRHLDNFKVAFEDYYYKYKYSMRLNWIQYEFRMFEAIYKHCDEEHEKVVVNYRHLISSNALSKLDALQKLIDFKQKCFENALADLGLSVNESE